MHLDANVASAGRLQKAGRDVFVVGDLAVGHVVNDDDAVLLGERHRPLEEGDVSDGRRGVAWVVDEEQLGLLRDVRWHRVEIGEEPSLLRQRQWVWCASRELHRHRVDGIAGVRHERDIAWVDEAEGDVADALLGADQGQDLLVGVEAQPEAALVPASDGLAVLWQAVRIRIALVFRVARGLHERVENVRRRRQVRVADGERDDIDAGGLLLGDLLADGREKVGWQVLYALGKLQYRFLTVI